MSFSLRCKYITFLFHLCRARFSALSPSRSLDARCLFFPDADDDAEDEEEDDEDEDEDEESEDEEEDEESDSESESSRSSFFPYFFRSARKSFFKRACISASGGVSN